MHTTCIGAYPKLGYIEIVNFAETGPAKRRQHDA
jgi:hypothetical protein